MRKMDLVLLVTLIAGVSLVANRGIQAGEDRTATASPPQAPLVVEGTNCKANLKSIATSLEMFATDHGGRYPSSLMELVPKYLPAIPRCSLSDHDTYLEGYSIKSRPDWYLVYCRGDAHAKDGLAADFPRFSSDKGPEPLTQDELPSCQDSLKNLATALEMYSTDNAGRYPTSLQQLMPNYLLRPPVCKVAGLDTYSRAYAVAQRPDAFTCICEGEHHHGEGLEPNFPQYSSTTGLIEK